MNFSELGLNPSIVKALTDEVTRNHPVQNQAIPAALAGARSAGPVADRQRQDRSFHAAVAGARHSRYRLTAPARASWFDPTQNWRSR